jgi:nitrite reductase/ring-hydroxylating ferredoxin subunit
VTWLAVCRLHDIPPDRGWPVRAGEHRIAVFDVGGTVRAVENTCVHLENPIDDGPVVGGCVTCPWHGWRYDLRTGEHLTAFGRRRGLRTYPVRVEDGTVYVELDT